MIKQGVRVYSEVFGIGTVTKSIDDFGTGVLEVHFDNEPETRRTFDRYGRWYGPGSTQKHDVEPTKTAIKYEAEKVLMLAVAFFGGVFYGWCYWGLG